MENTIQPIPPMQDQPTAVSARDAAQWHHMFSTNTTTSAGVRVTHRSVIGYPPFWRGVNLLANSVAGLPLNVYERDGDDRQIATRHPAQKLLKRQASPILRAQKFRKTMMAHALLFGNAFAWIERNARQEPIALWVQDPQQMTVRYFEGQLWYATSIEGVQVKFPGRDMFHITGLSHNGVTGYSAVDLMAEALGVGMAAQRFGSKFFGNGSNMSGLLMVPGHFSEEKIANTIAAWNTMQSGLENSHKIALLQDGVKFIPYTVEPNKAQFLETRNFEVRAVVASILGVPPHLLGDDSRTSHSSLEQENQSYLNHSLNPHLIEWEGECDLKLLSEREREEGSTFTEFNREAAVQMLFTERVDGIARQIETGVLTVNESRRRLNMPSVGPAGDVRYHPANWSPIGESPQTPPAAPPAPPARSYVITSENDETQHTDVLRAMIESSVTDAIAVEKRRVVAATRTADNFCAWMGTFYHNTWVPSSVRALNSPEALQVKIEYAQESQRQLLDVAGSSTADTLTGNVVELTDTWDERRHGLTDKLLGTI